MKFDISFPPQRTVQTKGHTMIDTQKFHIQDRIYESQVAISIVNANLYANLEKKVSERTRELEEVQKRMVTMEKEETETLMAGGFAHEMRNALSGAQVLLE